MPEPPARSLFAPRTAQITFHEPAPVVAEIQALSGLRYLEGIVAGRLPRSPNVEAHGIELVEVRPGWARSVVTPREDQMNYGGFCHGGFVATVIDATTGWAIVSTLDVGMTSPHVEASFQFIGAASAGTPLECVAEMIRTGRRVAHARAELRTRDDGRLLAIGESTHAVHELRARGTAVEG